MNLIEPNTVFLDYKNQFDLRLAKTFRFDRRIQGFADVFNVLNAGTVLRVNETYARGATVADAAAIMEARYLRFGMQMSF